MKAVGRSSLTKLLKQDNGQILPWMAFLTIVFLGLAGLTVDLGRAYVAYRELQASTDAAALAGAHAMSIAGATQATVNSQVKAFSSFANGANATTNLPAVTVLPTYACIKDQPNVVSAPCTVVGGYNVIQVMQTSTLPTIFIRALGLFGLGAADSITLRAYSTATYSSGTATGLPVNIAIVLDTTASMGSYDSACGTTQIKCALNGVQTLALQLTPCTQGSTATTCNGAFDQLSLFTFPPIQANTTSDDTSCPSQNPTIVQYFAPTPGGTWVNPTGTSGTYQITTNAGSNGYFDDYLTGNQSNTSISGSSELGVAIGAGGCQGVQTPGGDGTWLAGSIFAAQSSLMAAQAANGGQNIMIVLSDGDANAVSSRTGNGFQGVPTNSLNDSTGMTVTYPSVNDQCHQSIAAANYATSQNTTVYTIGYGAGNSGCATDTGTYKISPCSELQQMSSNYSTYSSSNPSPYFFTDSTSNCTGATVGSLDAVFGSIASQLSKARLIPNGLT